MDRQTHIFEASVEAAKRSAEAIINSERSWVIGDVEDLSIQDALLSKAAGSEVVPIFCTLKNYGVKPVWVVAASFELRIVDSTVCLPREPDYGEWKPLEGDITRFLSRQVAI